MPIGFLIGATVLDTNDVAEIALDYLHPRFGDNILIDVIGNKALAIVSSDITGRCRDYGAHRSFSQTMKYLSFPKTWYSKSKSAIELAFEATLAHNSLSFNAMKPEKRVIMRKPPEHVRTLENWTGESSEVSTYYSKWVDSYQTVLNHLKLKHPNNHTCSIDTAISANQRTLLNYFDLRTGGPSRRIKTVLEDFAVKTPVGWRPQKRKSTLSLRFDMLYAPMEKKLLVAEIKPTATLRKGDIVRRVAQMTAYNAWFCYMGDKETPLAYILPTITSFIEDEMIKCISETRPIIPICVTTDEFLRKDIEQRLVSSEIVTGERRFKPKPGQKPFEFSPEVKERHTMELANLRALEERLGLNNGSGLC